MDRTVLGIVADHALRIDGGADEEDLVHVRSQGDNLGLGSVSDAEVVVRSSTTPMTGILLGFGLRTPRGCFCQEDSVAEIAAGEGLVDDEDSVARSPTSRW